MASTLEFNSKWNITFCYPKTILSSDSGFPCKHCNMCSNFFWFFDTLHISSINNFAKRSDLCFYLFIIFSESFRKQLILGTYKIIDLNYTFDKNFIFEFDTNKSKTRSIF